MCAKPFIFFDEILYQSIMMNVDDAPNVGNFIFIIASLQLLDNCISSSKSIKLL